MNELKKYDEELYNKPRWLVLNKTDMLQDSKEVVKKFVKDYGWTGPVFAISAISGVGCKELTYAMMDHLDAVKKAQIEIEDSEIEDSKIDQKEPQEQVKNEPIITD